MPLHENPIHTPVSSQGERGHLSENEKALTGRRLLGPETKAVGFALPAH